MVRSSSPLIALLALLASNSQSLPCSLCGSLQSQLTLRQEFLRADLVVLGKVSNPQFNVGANAAPGSGTTDFAVLHVFKSTDQPSKQLPENLKLTRYIPLGEKDVSRVYLIFGSLRGNDIDIHRGKQIHSNEMISYLQKAIQQPENNAQVRLQHFYKYLDNADADIAADAFLEFAKTNDKDVATIAKKLPSDKLRRLLANPETPNERIGLFAFLLGSSQNPADRKLLEQLIAQSEKTQHKALDGLLCGYAQIDSQQGWKKILDILGDSEKSFPEQLAATRAVRFFHNWQGTECQPQVLQAMRVILADGEIADMALDDLRRWKMWDLTNEILALYNKKSHGAPITRRSIIRYALQCDQPQAQRFIQELRRTEADIISEVEEALAFETAN